MLLLSSHWDIYEEESTNPQNLNVENKIESNIPTNVHCAKERHILLFNKYKSIFSRTVNPEPAAVPPMTQPASRYFEVGATPTSSRITVSVDNKT